MSLVAGKRRVQERIDDLQRKARAGDTRAKREDVGIVVQSRRFGGEAVPAQGGADAADLVRGNGNTDAGAADQDPFFTFPARDGLCHRLGKDGIIAACLGISAEVSDLKAALLQMGDDLRLQGKAAVVASDCNHERVPP